MYARASQWHTPLFTHAFTSLFLSYSSTTFVCLCGQSPRVYWQSDSSSHLYQFHLRGHSYILTETIGRPRSTSIFTLEDTSHFGIIFCATIFSFGRADTVVGCPTVLHVVSWWRYLLLKCIDSLSVLLFVKRLEATIGIPVDLARCGEYMYCTSICKHRSLYLRWYTDFILYAYIHVDMIRGSETLLANYIFIQILITGQICSFSKVSTGKHSYSCAVIMNICLKINFNDGKSIWLIYNDNYNKYDEDTFF